MKCRFWLDQGEGWGLVPFTREGNPRESGFGREEVEYRLDTQRLHCLRNLPMGLLATPVDLCYSACGNPEGLPVLYNASSGET